MIDKAKVVFHYYYYFLQSIPGYILNRQTHVYRLTKASKAKKKKKKKGGCTKASVDWMKEKSDFVENKSKNKTRLYVEVLLIRYIS